MYLKKLIIRNRKGAIREVNFKKGLNLIIDETSSSSTDSGNNVGKTTFLRVIDYCFGGDKKDIYTDREFKRVNNKIYDFLMNTEVVFELSLESKQGVMHSIVRPIDGKSFVDGEELSSEPRFKEALLNLLFDSNGERPTLPQLMNKFIRIEDYQISNALYFLHNMADASEYEALFMFLFGFRNTELLSDKRRLVNKLKKLKKRLEGSNNNTADLEQQLYLIDNDILNLERMKKSFNFSEAVDSELDGLRKLQSRIADLKSSVAIQNLKYEMNVAALEQLKKSKSSISGDSIKALYQQARIELSQLTVKYSDVLAFHNQMVDNKTKYLESILATIRQSLTVNRDALNERLQEESKIVAAISQKGALDEYDSINAKLQELSRNKGIKEGLIQALEDVLEKISQAKDELNHVNSDIGNYYRQYTDNLKNFNVYFSDISNKLYGDKYYLAIKRDSNETTDNFLLDIGNMNETIGTGKKKAQISALDLAYLRYSESCSFSLPLFILHDQLETVFENQLETLFEVANSLNGQFVVAVLSDKLKKIDPEQIQQNCILRLSQDDKLFRLP